MFSYTTDIKNSGHLNSFMEWSVKLQDVVYFPEAYRITKAFEEKVGLQLKHCTSKQQVLRCIGDPCYFHIVQMLRILCRDARFTTDSARHAISYCSERFPRSVSFRMNNCRRSYTAVSNMVISRSLTSRSPYSISS